MRETRGDLFNSIFAEAICITTNGVTRNDGKAIMGRGVAQQARDLFPGIDTQLGSSIRHNGNVVSDLHEWTVRPFGRSIGRRIPIISFPVKHDWRQRADLELIEQSAHQLQRLTNRRRWYHVVLPRPGCGNGGRDWYREVRPILVPILDNRFVIVERYDDGPGA